MFRIIATIVMSLNGQPAAEPMQLANRMRYEDVDACEAGLKSDLLKASVDKLDAQISAQEKPGMSHVITTACEPAPDDGRL